MYNEFEHFHNADPNVNSVPAPDTNETPAVEADSATYTQDYSGQPQWQQDNQQPVEEPTPKKKKKGTAGKVVALALSCALIGGIAGTAGTLLMADRNQRPTNATTVYEGKRENSVVQLGQVDTSKEMTASQVYAANVNSTVGITTSITTNFWGYQTTSAASGSGFIISEDGYILTNYHVVEGSSAIKVALYDGTTYDAALVGFDMSNDIAVLKVEAQGLTPVVLGDSDNVNVGDTVIAIGNPLGELTFSLTQGVVSALDREVTFSNNLTMDLIQTDCAINSGNSGGALFNLHGEVIGITNAKYSSNSGTEASVDNIGFAIPMNRVKSIVESIIENGYIAKSYIGVTVTDVSAEAQGYGLPTGAAVHSVAADSPAEKAGLQESDIITKVNDTEITNREELVDLVGNSAVGDQLKLTVYRQGETLELTVTVGEQIRSALEQEEGPEQQQEQIPQSPQEGEPYFPWNFFGN